MFCINIFIVDIKMLKPGPAREMLDTGPAQEMLVVEYLRVICFFLLPSKKKKKKKKKSASSFTSSGIAQRHGPRHRLRLCRLLVSDWILKQSPAPSPT
jgi:hypothetical protein